MGYNDDFDNFDNFGVVENDDGDYGDSFSERYDMANGAPFGTFDFDGDGELDFLEGAAKLDHYQSLWDEEERLDQDELDDLDLDLGLYDKDDLEGLAGIYGVSEDFLRARGVELGFWDDDDEDDEDENFDYLWDEDSSTLMASDDEDSGVYYEDEDEDAELYFEDDDSELYYEDDDSVTYYEDEDSVIYYQDEESEGYNEVNAEIYEMAEKVIQWRIDFAENNNHEKLQTMFFLEEEYVDVYSEWENSDDPLVVKAHEYLLKVENYQEKGILKVEEPFILVHAALIIIGVVSCFDKEKKRARFIFDSWNDKIITRYLQIDGEAAFSKAVTDHFDVPVTLPSDIGDEKLAVNGIVAKIARKDIELAVQVWLWIIDNFYPYREYISYEELGATYIHRVLYNLSEEELKKLILYFEKHLDEAERIFTLVEDHFGFSDLIVAAIDLEKMDVLAELIRMVIAGNMAPWDELNELHRAITYEVLNEFFCKNKKNVLVYGEKILPQFENHPNPMVSEEAEEYRKKYNSFISNLYY